MRPDQAGAQLAILEGRRRRPPAGRGPCRAPERPDRHTGCRFRRQSRKPPSRAVPRLQSPIGAEPRVLRHQHGAGTSLHASDGRLPARGVGARATWRPAGCAKSRPHKCLARIRYRCARGLRHLQAAPVRTLSARSFMIGKRDAKTNCLARVISSQSAKIYDLMLSRCPSPEPAFPERGRGIWRSALRPGRNAWPSTSRRFARNAPRYRRRWHGCRD